MKLKALVKFNDEKALVLNKKIEFEYQKHRNLLIGMDKTKTFVDCLYYEEPRGGFKAFGGREFDITLDNGETINCNGQWWHGGFSEAEEILKMKLTSVTVKDIHSLRECYVFRGCFGVKNKILDLVADYSGKVYGYHEYERELQTKRRPATERERSRT